jgi:putative Na+/H+ antiporter
VRRSYKAPTTSTFFSSTKGAITGRAVFNFSTFVATFCRITMKIWLSLLCLLCLLIGTLTVNAAPPGEQKFPPSSDSYQDQSIPSLSGKLVGRVQQEPFNAAATIIFFLAITHTFLASRFQKIAHQYDVKVREIAKVDSGHDTRLDREWDRLLFRAQFFHFMGEIEAVFGIWLVPLVIAIVIFHGWSAMISYVGHANMAEAVFVVVIMAMASSLPILRLAENAIVESRHSDAVPRRYGGCPS